MVVAVDKINFELIRDVNPQNATTYDNEHASV
ncbi:hypothetical protein QFZ48_003777 [Chitinophaga sp. W2I13]